MGRPKVDLTLYKEFIFELYQNGATWNDIISALSTNYNIIVSKSTLLRRCQKWKLQFTRTVTEDSENFRECLRSYFFELGPSDEELVILLKQDGFETTPTAIRRIRKEMGLYRRHTDEQIELARRQLLEFFETPSQSSLLLPRLSRQGLYKHIHQVAKINIPVRPLFTTFKEHFLENVQARYQELQKRRGGHSVPGPNYMWCIDAYCKLQQYGFEIYAAIDAYSRFIPWIYVGNSALTERSILAQYITVVGEHGFLPMVIRSDRGSETTMVAAAHYWLSLGSKDTRRLKPRRNKDGKLEVLLHNPEDNSATPIPTLLNNLESTLPLFDIRNDLKFQDVWSYGKSTKNQRIEAWWQQLNRGRSLFWRVCLNLL